MEASRSCSKRKKAVLTLWARRETSVFHHIFLSPGGQGVDQLQQLMQVYDLAALRDYWELLGAAALQPLGECTDPPSTSW